VRRSSHRHCKLGRWKFFGRRLGSPRRRGTPNEIVDKLNAEINEAMKTPELIAAMAKLGFEPQFWSPQDYAAFLADEMRRWPPLVKAAGIKPE
jgi:tripartite-type tricarboxylate transporter receptor subunit TctC